MANQDERPDSRNIPLPVQREVRRRCGFGCVICGLPLYEYDHLLGWAVVQRHVAEEITLLCDQHHREKTSGLLPNDAVIVANSDPFNHRTGVTKPYDLHYSGHQCMAVIANNVFITKSRNDDSIMVPVSVDGVALLGFRFVDNHLLMILRIYDKFNNLALEILDNQLRYSMAPWDVQLVGRNLNNKRSAPQNIN